MGAPDPVWDELGRIDYLLDQLARAVERGELGRDVWDRLSPRYHDRRAELAAILSGRAARAATTPVATPAPLPAPVASTSVRPQPTPTVVTPVAAHRSSAGAWMSYAGALLVVIAVAIFTVYAWATFAPLLKLMVLLGVTAAFYVGGEVVRRKLELPAVGVALISVGSAMLLFDGWSVIRATGATGPLPWAAMLLVCSLGYWATEWRIAGGWFGAIGAAAQVGWWWMLGSALGWESYWVAAGVSVVAVAWAFASERVLREGPLGMLGTVLRVGSVVLAACTGLAAFAYGVTAQLGGAPAYWPVAAAALSALSFSFVVERLIPRPRGLSALGHLPLFAVAGAYWVALAAAGRPGPGWALLATFLAMAVAYDAYAPWRGSATYAIAGLAAEGLFWLGLADHYAWRSDVTVGVVLAFGLSAILAGRLLRRAEPEAARWPGALWAARVWGYGGVAVMALATLLVPAVGGVPLSGSRIAGGTALLALGVLAAWVAGSLLRRSAALGRVAFAWSFYTLAAALAWAYPSWHSAWYGAALLGLAALLSQSRTLLARLLRIPGDEIGLWCRLLYLMVPVLAAVGSLAFFRVDAYPVAALLALAGVAWLAEAVRTREWWALAPSTAAFAAAAAVAAWVASGPADAAIAAGAAALAIAAVGALGPRALRSWGAFAAAGGTMAATVIAVAGAADAWRLAVALLLVAGAWALTAVAASLPELAGLAGVFASFSLIAVLSWRDASPWMTVVALTLLAGSLLAPRVVSRSGKGSKSLRSVRALAFAGGFALAELCVIALLSYASGGEAAPARWLDLGATGAAVALALSGGYLISWTAVERIEAGLYPGIGIVVLGAMVQIDGWGTTDVEWFLVLAALYFAGMGVLWASRKAERRVPVGTDVAAFAIGVALPFALAVTGLDADTALRHGLWALGLAAASTTAGLLLRTRVYFQGGLTILVLDALWLSRSVLFALPSWVWIGTVGLALIGGGVVYARREMLGGVGRRLREGFAAWR
ncbi:MAG: hypothetical protein Q7W16_06055 [Coriobacteriia bacterium]|nr:hypothetical protein [Coriobacteriia bacterium]